MSAKFKIHMVDTDGNTKTLTENHPKLTATESDFDDASAALADIYKPFEVDEIYVNSDTSVYTAS